MRWWNNAWGGILVGKSRSIGRLPPREHHPYFQKLMELHPYFAYFQKVIGGPTLSSLIRVALHVAYCLSFTFAAFDPCQSLPIPFLITFPCHLLSSPSSVSSDSFDFHLLEKSDDTNDLWPKSTPYRC